MRGYRHELKYYISEAEYELMSKRLSLTMDRDEHARESGVYFIRSLYFDDYQESSLTQKLSGIERRDKYRVRIYNMRDDVIRLEQKHKNGLYVKKRSIALNRKECEALTRGDFSFLLRHKEPFAKELYADFRLKLLKPRVIVDYFREAYVFALEDVRVTFDMDIRTANRFTSLFDRELPTYPAIGEYDMVMEIKFNEYLPGYVRTLLQPSSGAIRAAISKYCLSRRFE